MSIEMKIIPNISSEDTQIKPATKILFFFLHSNKVCKEYETKTLQIDEKLKNIRCVARHIKNYY